MRPRPVGIHLFWETQGQLLEVVVIRVLDGLEKQSVEVATPSELELQVSVVTAHDGLLFGCSRYRELLD
jgi:hypothetical protein